MYYAFRCLQDAEVLVKLTEEVNGRLKNKVSPDFPGLNVLSHTGPWHRHLPLLIVLTVAVNPFLSGSGERWAGALPLPDSEGSPPPAGGGCRGPGQSGSPEGTDGEVLPTAAVGGSPPCARSKQWMVLPQHPFYIIFNLFKKILKICIFIYAYIYKYHRIQYVIYSRLHYYLHYYFLLSN